MGEAQRHKQTYLQRHHLDQGRKRVCGSRSDIIIRIAHAAENGDDEEDNIGQRLDIQLLDDI